MGRLITSGGIYARLLVAGPARELEGLKVRIAAERKERGERETVSG